MNIAMKFTADVNRAKENISQINAELRESANVAQDANEKSANSYRDVYTAQVEAMNRGASYAAEQEKQAKAQEVAAKAALAHKKEVDKLRNGLDQLLGSIDPATKGLGRLDTLEDKLRKSQKAGLLDNESFDNYLGKINNQRAALSTVDSLNTGTKKLSINTRTAKRDMVSMFRQLASGNMSSAGNSLFNLGNATGKLPPLFSAATLSVTVFIAAAYGMYKVISTILAEQERFNRALISTGNYAGTTAGGLEAMSLRIGKVNSNYNETRKIIADLASKGNLSAKSIENIGKASAYMSAITGKNADESVASFNGITDSVSKWALESTKQYNWLDVATYNRISALEEQGKAEEAIAVATDKYSLVMEQRTRDMETQLDWLTRGWRSLTKDVDESLNILSYLSKSTLSLTSDEEELAQLEKTKEILTKKINELKSTNPTNGWIQIYDRDIKKLETEIDALQTKLKPQQDLDQLKSEQEQITQKAILSQKELTDYWKQNRTEAEKQADAVEKIRKQYEALWVTVEGRKSLELKGVTSVDGKTFSGGQYDTDVKSITDKEIKAYNKELEKSLSLEKELSNYSKVKFETTEGKYKNASEAEKKQALKLAKKLDIKKQKEKNEKQTATNDKTNLDLQRQLNQLLVGSKVSDETVDQWYNNLLTQFKKAGNEKGIDLIDQLLPLKKADAQLNDITSKIQQAKTKQSTAEQSIQAQVTSGLITQVEAQSQLVQLHKATAKELSGYLPLLEKMATMPGEVGEKGKQAAAQLQLEMAELNKTTDALTNALRNGLQDGIQGALQGLATGTYNLSEALTSLGQSIASAMASIASQGLAELAMNGLDNISNSLFGSSTDAVADNASNAIAATEMSTAITTSGTVAAGEIGTGIATAGTISAETMSASIVTAGATAGELMAAAIISASSGSAAGNAGASAVGAAFATGGYISGPGTSTSDSIPARLSDGEYVVKAAAVKKYGINYLHAINTGRVHRYATGGLVSNVNIPSAPKLADFGRQSGIDQNQSAPVIQQTLVLDPAEAMQSGFKSVGGKRAAMTWIRTDAATIKQVLGVK